MAQDGPKMAQHGLRTAQDGPMMAQDGLQDGSKVDPRWLSWPQVGFKIAQPGHKVAQERHILGLEGVQGC